MSTPRERVAAALEALRKIWHDEDLPRVSFGEPLSELRPVAGDDRVLVYRKRPGHSEFPKLPEAVIFDVTSWQGEQETLLVFGDISEVVWSSRRFG